MQPLVIFNVIGELKEYSYNLDNFEGFETICLQFRSLLTMRDIGRVRRISAMVNRLNVNYVL